MTVVDTFRIAASALWRNRLRSFLTGLGMIIGVGAVIAMVAIGEGAKAKVADQFNSMGSNLLILMPGTNNSGGVRGGSGSQPTLTWDDLKAIQTELPSVKEASPQLRVNAQVMSEDTNWSTSIYGVSPEYFSIRTWNVAEGTGFTRTDVDGALKLALIGQTVADKLFPPGFDPVGRTIRIRNMPFQVAGVLESKGQSSYGADLDDAIFIPYTTFRIRIQGGLLSYIAGAVYISAASSDSTDRAETDIRNLLRTRHRLEDGTDDDFFIRNMTELAAATEEGMKTLSALLASVAAVSLLIGGIGIMNIMLVSVTERTREIGVRMAVGARPRDILSQFLIEALSLALAGGAIGVGAGVLAAQRLAAQFGWPMLIRPDVILIAVGFSGLIGIIFGLYPAQKAARLDPIEALRYE